MPGEREGRCAVALGQNDQPGLLAEGPQIFPRLEIDDEIDFVAARGKSCRQSRPHAFRAAADERMRVEQQSAGLHRATRAFPSDQRLVGDCGRHGKRAAA